MRVIDIINIGVPCRLSHPVVGNVIWKCLPISGWGLYFAEGPEKDQILVADNTVLIDENWTLISQE